MGDALGTRRPGQVQPDVRPYRKLAECSADSILTDKVLTVVEAMADYRKPAQRGK